MNTSCKVLQLRSSLGIFGAETMILELSKGLRSLGIASVVGVLNNTRVPHTEMADAAKQSGLETVVVDCNGPIDVRAARRLRDYVAGHDISLVHAHGYKANAYALLASRGLPVARVATVHPWTETSYNWRARLYTALDQRWLKRFHRIVAVSETVRDQVLGLGLPASGVLFIDNGIDVGRFNGDQDRLNVRRRLGLPVNNLIVGSIGRLVPEKGYERLLRAAKTVVQHRPDVRFVIVGEGQERPTLEALREQLGLQDHVCLLGQRNDVPELLKAFDLFVMSSVSEGLPMVILEAMAAGKAVVSTGVGAIPEVLEHGRCGLLSDPDGTDLAAKILELMGNEKKARSLAQAAQQRILRDYSCEAMAKKYAMVYEEALSVVRHASLVER